MNLGDNLFKQKHGNITFHFPWTRIYI